MNNEENRNPGEGWKIVGQDAVDVVDTAIHTGDYSRLVENLSRLFDHAVDATGQTISAATFEGGRIFQQTNSMFRNDIPGYHNATTSREGYEQTKTAEYIHHMNQSRYSGSNNGSAQYTYVRKEVKRDSRGVYVPYVRKDINPLYKYFTIEGVLALIGAGIAFMFGGLLLASFISVFLEGALGVKIFAALFSVVPLGILAAGALGCSFFARVNRFNKYVASLKGKEYAAVKELAKDIGKSEKAVRKDLKKMIQKKWFRQGHMDEQETTLMTSDRAYEEYRKLTQERRMVEEEQARKDAEEAQKKAREEAEYARYTPAQREVIEQCEKYVGEIRRCNDAIPGEVFSDKLSRLEHSTRVIVDRVKEEPGLSGELRRLLNYYLPTTIKLLDAYIELDSQEKQTETILNSKKEIEGAVDAMNDGFDKLYDSLFQNQSLDISTDVEVMRTLLEQEGLTGKQFSSNMEMPGTEGKSPFTMPGTEGGQETPFAMPGVDHTPFAEAGKKTE